jgi:hypothetical protein
VTTYTLAPLKVAAMRLTLLDSCGNPNTGTCATFSTKTLASLAQTGEVVDGAEHQWVNADGDLEIYLTDPPQLKYLGLEITATQVTPEMMNWLTGDSVVSNDASTPSAIGWHTATGGSVNSSFALELWTRLGSPAGCTTPAYGYVLFPWCYSGMFYEVTHENAPSVLKITAKTRNASPWGIGPYSVQLSAATATLGQPIPLLSSVPTKDHKILLRTMLAPPAVSTDCTSVVGTMTVVDNDTVGAGLAATATIPATALTPGYVDWGDASSDTAVAAGATTATHTYALAGTYTVTYRSTVSSDRVYTGSVTMA